jgi:hypothetical protein
VPFCLLAPVRALAEDNIELGYVSFFVDDLMQLA